MRCLPCRDFYKHCKDILMVLTEKHYGFLRSCICPMEESVSTIQWCSVNTGAKRFQQFYEQSQSNSGMDGEVTILNPQISKNARTCPMLIFVFIKTMFHNILLQTHHYLSNIFNEENYAFNVFLY